MLNLKVLSCAFGDVPVPELLDVVPAPLSESTTVSHEEPKEIIVWTREESSSFYLLSIVASRRFASGPGNDFRLEDIPACWQARSF